MKLLGGIYQGVRLLTTEIRRPPVRAELSHGLREEFAADRINQHADIGELDEELPHGLECLARFRWWRDMRPPWGAMGLFLLLIFEHEAIKVVRKFQWAGIVAPNFLFRTLLTPQGTRHPV